MLPRVKMIIIDISVGSNRSRTFLHVLLSKLPNPVTSLPSSGLYTG